MGDVSKERWRFSLDLRIVDLLTFGDFFLHQSQGEVDTTSLAEN